MAIPVLIITYSRVDGLERLLNSCIEAAVQRIYVAIDGPRNLDTTYAQDEMTTLIAKLEKSSGIEIKVWQRTENLGIAVSVITAIDWFFRNEILGAILEDDLVVSQDFFIFAERALRYFEHHDQIQIISGNRYDGSSSSLPIQVSYPQTWGWATWGTSWKTIREQVSSKPVGKLSHIRLAIRNFWQVGAERVWAGYVDTWDLLVARILLANEKTCLLPPINLVSNVGFDVYATHTNQEIFPIGFPIQKIEFGRLDLSQIENSVSFDGNKFLEKRVFGIRRRHVFLRIYRSIVEVRMTRKFDDGSLSKRLGLVAIP
jgi:hypothetical protein